MERITDLGGLTESFSESRFYQDRERVDVDNENLRILQLVPSEIAKKENKNIFYGEWRKLTPIHEFKEITECFYIIQGGKFIINGIILTVGPGDCLIIPLGHSIQIIPEKDKPVIAFLEINRFTVEGDYREVEGHRGRKPEITFIKAPKK